MAGAAVSVDAVQPWAWFARREYDVMWACTSNIGLVVAAEWSPLANTLHPPEWSPLAVPSNPPTLPPPLSSPHPTRSSTTRRRA